MPFVSLLCVEHAQVMEGKVPVLLLHSPAPTSSGELLQYSLPHSSFLPFLYLSAGTPWGSVLKKTRNPSHLLALMTEQILTSRYSDCCTGLCILQSYPQLILRSLKMK